MQYLILIKQFVSENQILLTTALLIGAYFIKRLVDYKAANPAIDTWDSIKPGTDALYSLVHRGVEYAANAKGMDSAKKLLVYAERVAEFERMWSTNKARAIQELAAWFLSMKAKNVTANPSTPPLTADSVAVEITDDDLMR